MADGHIYKKIITTGADKDNTHIGFYAKATGLFYKIFGATEVQIAASTDALQVATAGGTVDAITATFTPALTLTDKVKCIVIASGANTSTTPTFAPDGLTAHTIVSLSGVALAVGDIPAAGSPIILEYNSAGTNWFLCNPAIPKVVVTKPSLNNSVAPASTAYVDNGLCFSQQFLLSVPGSPADNTTYYGQGSFGASQTASTLLGNILPFNCRLIGATINVQNTASNATSETFPIIIRKNDTTDLTIHAGVNCGGTAPIVNNYSVTGLTTDYVAGDKIQMKIITPNPWATNPTGWRVELMLYFIKTA